MLRYSLPLLTATLLASAAAAGPLELKRGDRVCVVGNTLADRMQHDGWLDTYLHARFPEHDLVVRNLGFSGDEVTHRSRSDGFGSPDEWLRFCKADVVLAFFGYNESFAGEAGLAKYKADLANYTKHLQSQKFNGSSAPRVVLVSPTAHENLRDPNLPDGTANNARLKLYAAATAEVAAAAGVSSVDLFTPTESLFSKPGGPYTINGVHFNEAGNRYLAKVIVADLFGAEKAKENAEHITKLRDAALDKNFHWFHRYRTTDGYSIYGGRADLKFTNGQTNRVVAQRELEVLDVMTANRDKRIWAVARGGDLAVDDSNTPPFVPVITNKPGKGPNGAHILQDGDEAIKSMTVAKGLRVNLFASEKQFPELINPVQMSWDTKGRLWVAVWPSYPHWKPKELMNDKLLIFEDTDGDGRADVCKTFADHLHNPTGFEFYNGGVLVANAPGVLFIKDNDGDDRSDTRTRVLDGIDSADTHHTSNSFTLDPGGALYFQEGTFHHTQVETPWGPTVRSTNAGVFRYEPRAHKFGVHVAFGFANPHGHVWDRWGQDIVVDGTGANPYHGALFSGHLDYPAKHARPPQVYQQRTRPCPGLEILTSRHFPDDWQGDLLVPNVIGFQGILRYKLRDDGASLKGNEAEPVLSSTDPNFRPSDVKVGPDGAIYFTEWHNPIIGHMQHNLRDPSRNKTHGRVYRVSYQGRPLLTPKSVAGESVPQLLELLKEPEDRVRYRAKIELGGRDSREVTAAAKSWAASLDPADPNYSHHLCESLWVHQYHNAVDVELLRKVLLSPDFRARAAAARVLCYWRDRVPGALETFKKLAVDPHPRVRLEAVRAASFFTEAEAVEVALASADQPSDQYIDYVRTETMKALDPHVKRAIAAGQEINITSDAGARYFLRNLPLADLMKMKRSRAVCVELLFRPGVRDEDRRAALAELARTDGRSETSVLVNVLGKQGALGGSDDAVAFDLARLLAGRGQAELTASRKELESLAKSATTPVTRELGYVALVAADRTVERVWEMASRSPAALGDLVAAVPLVGDPGLRAAFYNKVEPLLQRPTGQGSKATAGRYVRIELSGARKTLTLAEVEVYSGGRNVARGARASQKTTASGGDAARAVDGNTSPEYGNGGQTHTQENSNSPWWEVDLGCEYPVESVAVYNRGDGQLGKRLDGFTIQVLNESRAVVFERKKQPAPPAKVVFEVGGVDPERALRGAAMLALTAVRGQEERTFRTLAKLAKIDADRAAAVTALSRVPAQYWPKDEAAGLLDVLTRYARSVPAKERTSAGVVDALQLADSLAGLLPADRARAARKELGELGVRIVRVGTVIEQMRYDQERVVVRAGKPLEIVFENTDAMPHNLVIANPGQLEPLGRLAEATASDPDAAKRHFVPKSKEVLLASRLLQPRESQRLGFTAPTKPGVYPMVCTYPGHWSRMYAALYVVDDLEEYQADAEKYLAQHPLPIADELLKSTKPRTEWKVDDLAAAASQLSGRSFAHGKQLFQAASCAACHQLQGVGVQIGQDLTKIDPKYTNVDVLRHILEPSLKIDEKYQSWTLELDSGKVATGLIVSETPDEIRLLDNPLAKADPAVFKKADVVERRKSPSSIMPKGLLDKLTREEVLDLLAYVIAGGDERHKVYGGGHAHGAHGAHGGH